MLQSIRDRTHGWIAGIIISLLILSFALWGIHSYFVGTGANNVVAKVNGAEITKNQLAAVYERLRHQFQAQSGNGPLPAQTDTALKQRALQTLIEYQVLEQAVLADNYRITTNQIDGFLQEMPEFQVNGEFSAARLQQALNAALFTLSDFLELIKTTLLIDQARLGIVLTSYATPNEVNNTIALISEERNIQYLLIPSNYFKNQAIVITDQNMQSYYQQHQSEFKTPEKVSIEYILFSMKDLANRIQPTEEQLKNFYNENKDSFKSFQSYEKAKAKVKETLARQKAEEEFADKKEKIASLAYEHPDSLQSVAQEFNIPVLVSGPFTRDKGDKNLTSNIKVREAAFSHDVLNLQNNSDVIQINPDEMLVLRVKSHMPAAVLPLNMVQNQIEEKLKTITREDKLSQLANEIKEKLLNRRSTPAEISTEYHLQWINSGFIGRHAMKIDQAILDSAFEMPFPHEGKVTYAATKTTDGFAVIGLAAVKPGNTNIAKEQYQAFADQIQNSQGALEYELYKNSLIEKSKIVIEN
ncbi:MAG TPA: SurA N-terminal domain-containing protein [Gammaproteobacteria bacterium]|nr:SurA N-terminal domain-containing protein [Gammaproteobacteria bacterium]